MKKVIRVSAAAMVLLFTGIALYAQQNYSLSGKVTDVNLSPLPGAVVRVTGTPAATVSGEDGKYLLRMPGKGEYRIRITFTGYRSKEFTVSVDGDENADIVLETDEITTSEVIVSAIRAGKKAPFTYTSVSGELLKGINSGRDMPFLLSATPSLVETSESGTGIGYTGLRIRGSEGSRINVTVDGIPLNDAESQQVFWVDLPDLASSVSNIQVQRGVGTSSNGAGAFGASINILSENPSTTPAARAEAGYGSFNTSRLMLNASTGLIGKRFAMDIRYSDIGSDGYIRRSSSRNNSARISAMYRMKRSVLKSNIILGKEVTGISWWGVPAEMLSIDRRYNPAGLYTNDNGETVAYGNETDNYNQNHYNISFSSQNEPGLNYSLSLHYTRGEGYYEEYREERAFSDYGLPNDTIGGVIIDNSDMIRRKWMENDFYGAVWSLRYNTGSTEFVAGGGLNRYDGNHFGKIIWMKYSGKAEPGYEWYRNRGIKSEFSIYAKVNHAFSLVVNGFADLQYRRIGYTMSGLDDDLLDLGQEHTFDFFNPKAGLFFTFSEQSSAFVSVAVAGREPTRSDFKEAKGDPAATPDHETLYDAEAGYSFRSEKLNAGLNLFFMWYHNQLVPTGELSDVGYPVMTNVEKSYRAGAEFSAAVKPINRLELKANLTISRNRIQDFVKYYLDYNTSDWSSEYKNMFLGDVDIAYSPSVTASAVASFDFTESFSLELVTKYVGPQYFDNTMSAARRLKPYSVSGLRAEYSSDMKNGAKFSARFNLNNIFNSMYISNGYGGFWYEDGVEKTWAYYFPQAGINYMLTLGLSF